MINTVTNPEHMDPIVMTVLAVLAWGGLLISLRREAVRKQREARLEREAMLAQYESSLRRSGWAD
jgi:hypothetical protein